MLLAAAAGLTTEPTTLRDVRYQAALQWIPDLTQDARLSLAYVGKTTTYNDAIELPNISTNRVELSLIYRIKIF